MRYCVGVLVCWYVLLCWCVVLLCVLLWPPVTRCVLIIPLVSSLCIEYMCAYDIQEYYQCVLLGLWKRLEDQMWVGVVCTPYLQWYPRCVTPLTTSVVTGVSQCTIMCYYMEYCGACITQPTCSTTFPSTLYHTYAQDIIRYVLVCMWCNVVCYLQVLPRISPSVYLLCIGQYQCMYQCIPYYSNVYAIGSILYSYATLGTNTTTHPRISWTSKA